MTADETSGPHTGDPASSPPGDASPPPGEQPGDATPASDADPEGTPAPQEAEAETKLTLDARVEDVGPCKKRLHVEVDRKHVDEKLGETLDKLVETAMVPGFRPGRAPRALVAKRFRREMDSQVRGELVGAAFEQALDELDLTLLGQPDLKPEDIQLEDDGPLVFETEIEVRPQFALPSYKGLDILRPEVEVTDANVDEAIESLRDRGATLVPKGDEPAEAGDVLVADLTLTQADRTVRRDTEVSLRVEPTGQVADLTLEGFQDAMVGVRTGEQRVCQAQLSDDSALEDLRGQHVQCTVAVKDVKRVQRQELDQEALAGMGFQSLDELRAEMRRRLTARLQQESESTRRQQVYDHLLQQADWDLPEGLVDREAERLDARFRLDLMARGVPTTSIDEYSDALMTSHHDRAVRQLKSYFLLDRIAKEEDITVDPGDVDAQIRMIATKANESPRRIRARLEKQDRMGLLEIQVLEEKTVDRILESAQFEDVSVEEFRRRQEASSEADTESSTPEPPSGEGPPPAAGS